MLVLSRLALIHLLCRLSLQDSRATCRLLPSCIALHLPLRLHRNVCLDSANFAFSAFCNFVHGLRASPASTSIPKTRSVVNMRRRQRKVSRSFLTLDMFSQEVVLAQSGFLILFLSNVFFFRCRRRHPSFQVCSILHFPRLSVQTRVSSCRNRTDYERATVDIDNTTVCLEAPHEPITTITIISSRLHNSSQSGHVAEPSELFSQTTVFKDAA